MEIPEDQIIKKSPKHCGRCNRNTLLPYKYDGLAFQGIIL